MNHDLIQDAQALLGKSSLDGSTRRQALQMALGVGYAAAAGTVMAQPTRMTISESGWLAACQSVRRSITT